MATVVNREAPYSGLANLMAMRGRMGDTELVHMSPSEIKGLASLGQLTVNPDTGLPEAFKLKSLLPTIAGIGAAVATGGTSLLIPAVATGLTSAVVNKDIGRGLFDGLLSYAGGSIMRGLSGGAEFASAAGGAGTDAAQSGLLGAAMPPQSAVSAAANQVTGFQNAIAQSAASGPVYGGAAAGIPSAASVGTTAVPSAVTPYVGMANTYTPTGTLGKIGESLFYNPAPAGGVIDPMRLAAATYGTPQSTLGSLTAGQTAKFFAPQAAMAVGMPLLEDALTPEPYQQAEPIADTPVERRPRTLTRTALRSTPVTEEEALAAATGTGPGLRFSDYTTTYDTPTATPSPSSVSSFLNSLVDNRKFSFVKEGGLVGLATGGGIPPIQEAGDPSNDPQSRGTGIIGGVNITEPIDMGLGMFNPSPLGMGLGLVGALMGVPGLGLAAQMIDTPNVNALGQVQAYGTGNQSIDSFGNVVGTTEADIASMSSAPATPGVTPGLQDPMGVFGDFTSSGDGIGGMGSDTGSGDQGDTGVGHGAGEGTADGNPGDWAAGGLIALQQGGLLSPTQNPSYFEGMVPGTAHGMKDNVAFKVQGGSIDTAMLSPGEYVIPADVVSMLGNGNGDSGAKQLDAFSKGIRQKAFGTKKQQRQINAPKELEQLATA